MSNYRFVVDCRGIKVPWSRYVSGQNGQILNLLYEGNY